MVCELERLHALLWFRSKAMEPSEISVVISRAAQLHANISAAIDRSLKSDLGSNSVNIAREYEKVAEFLPNGASPHRRRHRNSRDLAVHGAAEARSLASIRDALEVLEEQLECLQTLQHQQRAEKDATLAELEESREIFIRRLKKHRGREWEVINEALLFAGEPEPLQEKDDLPLPPYYMPLATDPAAFANLDVPFSSFERNKPVHADATFKHLHFADKEDKIHQGINSAADEDCERMDGSEERRGSLHQNDVHRPFVANGCIFSGLKNQVFKFFKGRVGKASGKIFLLVAGAAAVIYGRQKSLGSGTRDTFLGSNISTELWQKSRREACPPGKRSVLQDGVQICGVRERREISFENAVHNSDVSYGR